MYGKSVKIVGQFSRLRGHIKCPWSLDNMNYICCYWQIWINMLHMEQSGLRWS